MVSGLSQNLQVLAKQVDHAGFKQRAGVAVMDWLSVFAVAFPRLEIQALYDLCIFSAFALGIRHFPLSAGRLNHLLRAYAVKNLDFAELFSGPDFSTKRLAAYFYVRWTEKTAVRNAATHATPDFMVRPYHPVLIAPVPDLSADESDIVPSLRQPSSEIFSNSVVSAHAPKAPYDVLDTPTIQDAKPEAVSEPSLVSLVPTPAYQPNYPKFGYNLPLD